MHSVAVDGSSVPSAFLSHHQPPQLHMQAPTRASPVLPEACQKEQLSVSRRGRMPLRRHLLCVDAAGPRWTHLGVVKRPNAWVPLPPTAPRCSSGAARKPRHGQKGPNRTYRNPSALVMISTPSS